MTVFQNVRRGLIPARLTVAEVYALQAQGIIDERERFELVDGEIVPMAAAKSSHHEGMKSRLIETFAVAKPGDVGIYVESSVTLNDATFVEPDLAFWPKGIASQEVRGPDLLLVVEVAASSLAYDLREKARLYATHGVRDYWVVDAIRRTIRVHRAPAEGRYDDVEEYGDGDTVTASAVPDLTIRLDALDWRFSRASASPSPPPAYPRRRAPPSAAPASP